MFAASLDSVLSLGNQDYGGHNVWDVAADAAGNSYVTGSFSGTVDFDPGVAHVDNADILTARGSAPNMNCGDIFVAKYRPDNTLVWATRMGGDLLQGGNTDTGRKIAVDATGAVFVTGKFGGTADFGQITLTAAGDNDGFVAKLDASGVVQWANRWGSIGSPGTYLDDGYGVGVDSAGNVYALGIRTQQGIDVRKYGASGGLIWTRSVDTGSVTVIGDLAVSAAGESFVAGTFTGLVDFDPSVKKKYVNSNGRAAGYVVKLDTDGKLGWVNALVGVTVGQTTGSSWGRAIALDRLGNVIVGGEYRDSVDFDNGSKTTILPPVGGAYIAKLNSSGSLVWAKALEDTSSIGVWGLAVDGVNSIYATGSFYGVVDLDPSSGQVLRASGGDDDVFVVKLDSAGAFQWAETIGGIVSDTGNGVAVDGWGVVHIAGRYRDLVDFDPDPLSTFELSSPRYSNVFRLRLRQA